MWKLLKNIAKGKHYVLSIEEKLDVIKRFEKAGSASKLVSTFCVRGTSSTWLKKKHTFNELAASKDLRLSKRKIMKGASLDYLDKAVFTWFNLNQSSKGKMF